MSAFSEIAAVFHRFNRWRSPAWRTRGGFDVGVPLARGLGLPVRLAVWGCLGVGLFFGMKRVIAWVAPQSADSSIEAATPWATLHVACTNPACHAAGSVRQPMDFKAWPLPCERCQQMTVQRATLCARCGTWIVPAAAAGSPCWRCAELAAASQPKKPPRKPSDNPDDDEDGW